MENKDLKIINKYFDELKSIIAELPNGEALGTEVIIKTAVFLSKTYGSNKSSDIVGYLETAKYLFMQRQKNLNSALMTELPPEIKKMLEDLGGFPK